MHCVWEFLLPQGKLSHCLLFDLLCPNGQSIIIDTEKPPLSSDSIFCTKKTGTPAQCTMKCNLFSRGSITWPVATVAHGGHLNKRYEGFY